VQVLVSRRLSQRISEGDGIAIIVRVEDAASARAAEHQGAKGVALSVSIDGIRDVTSLPLLWLGATGHGDCDAVALRPDVDIAPAGAEAVADVRDEDELEEALERLDPEIFLLSPRGGDDHEDPLELVLELLADVPAGKLAIADVAAATRQDVLALERAGVDAVLVPPGDVAELVGHGPVEV
jgi:hypothetical protein